MINFLARVGGVPEAHPPGPPSVILRSDCAFYPPRHHGTRDASPLSQLSSPRCSHRPRRSDRSAICLLALPAVARVRPAHCLLDTQQVRSLHYRGVG